MTVIAGTMSLRPRPSSEARVASPIAASPSLPDSGGAQRLQAAVAFDALHPVEKRAAELGVHPDALKPIGFLNAGHYKQLQEQQLALVQQEQEVMWMRRLESQWGRGWR